MNRRSGTTGSVPAPLPGVELDDALARLSSLEFPPPAYFANHGPMAAEALVTLGAADELAAWTAHFEAQLVPGPTATDDGAAPTPAGWDPGAGWRDELGDRHALARWYGYFARAVEGEGPEATVRRWVPRLAPAVSGGLYHGVIRTAHAVRSLDRSPTPARRAELAQALAHWACWASLATGRDRSVEDVEDVEGGGDGPAGAALDLANRAAVDFVTDPDIVTLHRVTGSMAVDLLVPRLPEADGASLVAHLAGALGSSGVGPDNGRGEGPWSAEAEAAARTSFDAHQVKLVEACHRGYAATGAEVFAEAARVVTGTAEPAGTGDPVLGRRGRR